MLSVLDLNALSLQQEQMEDGLMLMHFLMFIYKQLSVCWQLI
jgi:hypothetical protein